jgi:hypothetical protein
VIFKAVEFDWHDKTFTVPADHVLGAIAIVEEHFTFQDLANAMETKKLSLTRLARCYGDVLRYAGATVTDDEVYAGMFVGDMALKIRQATDMLLAMMIPPSVLAAAEETTRGNARAPGGRGKGKPSKRSTKH